MTATRFSAAEAGQPTVLCPRCRKERFYYRRPTLERITGDDGKPAGFARGEIWALDECDCVRRKRQADEAWREARDKQQWIERCIHQGNIDPRFKDCRFETWEHTPETEPAYQAAYKCAQAVAIGERDSGLILLGGPGNGKNMLAACICRYAAEHFRTFIYQSVPGLLKEIQATYDKQEGGIRESTIMQALTECDLIVLNDWGAEKWNEWVEAEMFYIIDQAYNHCRNVVVTSNALKMKREPGDPAGLPALRDMMSERVYSRLLHMCPQMVINAGSDYRRKIAKERRA